MTPFGSFVSAIIVAGSPVIRKCAILLSFLHLQIFDRRPDLTQYHFGYIACRAAENGNGLRGVEIKDANKILAVKILARVHSAAGQQHKGDAVRKRRFQPYLGIQLVQLI